MHILDVLSYLQSVSVYSEDNDDDTHGKKHEFETYQDFSNTLAFLRNHITESDTNVNAILGKAEFASYIVLECFEIFSKKEFPLCSAGVWIEYFSHFVPLTVSWPLDIHYRAAIIMKGILSSSNEKLESTLQHRYGSVLDPLGPDQGYNISNAVGDLSNFTRDLSLCIGDVHCIIKLLLKFSYVMKYGEPLGNQRQKEGSWISTAKLKAVRDSIFDFEYNIARYISSKTANFAPKYNSEQANAPPMKNHDIVSYGEYIKKLRTKFVNMEKFMKCILVEILTLHSLLTKYCEMHQRSVQQDYTTDLGNSAGKDSPRQLTPRDDDSNYSFAEDTYILECLTFMKNEVENILESLYTIEPAEFCICIFDAWRNSEVELHSGIFPLSLCCINSANICDSISPTNIQGPRSMKFLDSVKPHLRKSLINYSIATLKNSPNYLIQKSQPSQPPISSGKASLANIISFHYYLLKCSDSRDTLNTCTEFFSAIRTFLNKCKYFSQRDFPEGTAMIFYPMLVYVDALTTSDDTRNAKEIKEIEDVFVKAAEFCSGLILHSHGSYNLSSSIVKYDETDQAAYQKTLKPREPHYSLTLQRTNVSTDLEYVLKELDVLYDVIVHMNKANHGCIKLTNSLQIIFNLTAGTMLKSGAISNIHIYNKLLKIVREFIKVPKMQKIWKPVVMDKFFSSDFFHTDKSITPGWIHIVNALINDKLVIKDLVSRVNKAPTSNLFTSREQDTQIKACSIKRLAFCVLSGTQSVLYDHMPAIRDKLISLLKCREDALRPEVALSF